MQIANEIYQNCKMCPCHRTWTLGTWPRGSACCGCPRCRRSKRARGWRALCPPLSTLTRVSMRCSWAFWGAHARGRMHADNTITQRCTLPHRTELHSTAQHSTQSMHPDRPAVKFKDKAREKQRRAVLKQKEAQRAQQAEQAAAARKAQQVRGCGGLWGAAGVRSLQGRARFALLCWVNALALLNRGGPGPSCCQGHLAAGPGLLPEFTVTHSQFLLSPLSFQPVPPTLRSPRLPTAHCDCPNPTATCTILLSPSQTRIPTPVLRTLCSKRRRRALARG